MNSIDIHWITFMLYYFFLFAYILALLLAILLSIMAIFLPTWMYVLSLELLTYCWRDVKQQSINQSKVICYIIILIIHYTSILQFDWMIITKSKFKQWWSSILPIPTNQQSPLILIDFIEHDTWCWHSRSWFGTGTHMWWI